MTQHITSSAQELGDLLHGSECTSAMESFRKIYPSEFYRKFLVHNVRPDGRSLSSVRQTTVSCGSISTADGSSFVKLGQTAMVAGVKAEVGAPTAKSPVGQIVVNVELLPICSAQFRAGKPAEQAQVLGEFLNDLVCSTLKNPFQHATIGPQGSGARLVWYLYVDIYCLNYDGNIYDASLLALIAALKNVRLPAVDISQDGTAFVKPDHAMASLDISDYPVALTFGTVDEHILADPTGDEELLLHGSFTVVYGSKGGLCSVVKPGGAAVSSESLQQCMHQCKQRVADVVALIDATEQQ
eukprot:TRINITY_DN3983_c0_g1_i2.p1 TRINITY_DN3983_c0_g1~~TRINITY_DN3983_c0_g1_i2.p1  ORF type:complete len:321 (-),score=23.88 TRINITY_DN3983_c0_g1_i2:12-905(-)